MTTATATRNDMHDYTILFQNHGTAMGYWEGWVETDGTVVVQYAKTMEGKATRRSYQAEGKNIGKANETTPLEQGCLELASKARLKQDKGYVVTQEMAKAPSTNTLGLEKPMLATPLDKIKPEKIQWYNAYVQPKLDGHRALYKDGVLYSRQGKVLDIPHIVAAIKACDLHNRHLDGELYLHGKSLQDISKLIKKARPETPDLEYHIYDQMTDQAFHFRNADLQMMQFQIPGNSPLKIVNSFRANNMDVLMHAHNTFRDQGYEGTMLRFGSDGYQDGKRSRTLIKLKEFHDAEFKVVDVREGKPYIKENETWQVPVWVCETPEGKRFEVLAQGNMQIKDAFWHSRANYLGQLLTVKYHYLSADGIPQLPIALRFYETV